MLKTLCRCCFRCAWSVLFLLLLTTRWSWAEDLVIPGSGNPEYVLGQLAKAFNASQSQHRVSVPSSVGTAGGLRALAEGSASLARVGRFLKEEERSQGLTYVALGRDPVVLVAGAAVDVRNIGKAQVVDVYRGKISDWRELGGKTAPIRAIGREASDASRQALERTIASFKEIVFGAGIKVVHLDPNVIELLDRYPSSLGFLNRSALGACTTRVVPLSLDGVAPSVENVEKGSYPMSLDLGLAHKQNGLTAAGRAFLDFVQSTQGRRILREHGVASATSR